MLLAPDACASPSRRPAGLLRPVAPCDAKPSTRTGRAAALTVFFQFLELRHRVTCRYPSREGLGVCAPASGRRWSKQLVDDDVSVALAQLRPQSAGAGEGTRDLRMALLPLSRQLGEQRRGIGIGARRADEDPVKRLGPRHDAADDASQTRQLALGILVRKKRTDVGPVRQRDCLVVTGY